MQKNKIHSLMFLSVVCLTVIKIHTLTPQTHHSYTLTKSIFESRYVNSNVRFPIHTLQRTTNYVKKSRIFSRHH